MAGLAITLVVNADDFGLSEGINRAIALGFHQGILRSASLMPNGSAFDDAVRTARSSPGLGVGVHLSLVAEHCIAPRDAVAGLAGPDGSLPASYAAFAKGYFLKRFGLREVRAEIEAQIQRVLDAGIRPSHIDSHQHVHVLPGIIDVVIAQAKRAQIPVVRIPLERGGPGPCPVSGRGIQLRILSLFSRLARSKLVANDLKFADFFWGVGVSGRMGEANLCCVMNSLRDGVNEIMCHPGFGDPETRQKYPWNYAWDEETAALHSAVVERIISEKQIRLANFTDAWTMEG